MVQTPAINVASPVLLLWALCILITCLKFQLIVSPSWMLLLDYFFHPAVITYISSSDFFSAIKLIIIRLLNNIFNADFTIYSCRVPFLFSSCNHFVPVLQKIKCSLKHEQFITKYFFITIKQYLFDVGEQDCQPYNMKPRNKRRQLIHPF